MQPTQPHQPRRRLPITPQMQAYLNATHERLLDTLRSPDADPMERTSAWKRYRTERFIETGMEGLTGPDATYHLVTDFGGLIGGMARGLSNCTKKNTRAATKDVLLVAQKAVGFRWCRGVEGLLATLESQASPRERCTVFEAERDVFAARYGRLCSATTVLLEERQTEPAFAVARCLVVALIQEAEHLADWLEEADKGADARALRNYAEDAGAELAGDRG